MVASKFAVEQLNKLNLPQSILIIPDGNGRWAKNLGLSIEEGHKRGGETIYNVLLQFLKLKTSVMGIWAFSEDNWKRSKEETDNIMQVIEDFAKKVLPLFLEHNIKFIVLGKQDRIRAEYPSLFRTLNETIQKTSQNSAKTLALFLDYGERFQLEEFAKERMKNATLPTNELLSKINQGLPMFDMILRTSGELRISGFGPLAEMAEFVSVKKNLPDLDYLDVAKALLDFSKRQRRFGGRK